MKGRHLSIEVKIGGDKISLQQIREQTRIEQASGLYFVARDMFTFVNWFKVEFEEVTIKKER